MNNDFISRLPKEVILLNSYGLVIPNTISEKEIKKSGKRYIMATCHYRINTVDGQQVRQYYTTPSNVQRMMFMTPIAQGEYAISRILTYGVETEYSKKNLSGKWRLATEAPEVETVDDSDIPFK